MGEGDTSTNIGIMLTANAKGKTIQHGNYIERVKMDIDAPKIEIQFPDLDILSKTRKTNQLSIYSLNR